MGMEKDFAIGIDIGGTDIKGAIIDRNGRIITKGKQPTGAGKGKDTVIGNITTLIKNLLNKELAERIAGIGIGVPGSVDTRTGTIKAGIANVPELNGVCLVEEIAKKYQYPGYLDNDATNAAKGEFYFGAGRGYRNLLVLTVGTGIGGGIILNGSVYHGTSDYAGEIGHTIVVPSGKPCSCGNYGCIEAYSSGTAMVNYAKWKNRKGVRSALNGYGDEELTPRLIEDLADDGDKHCKEIIHQAGKYLGICLASLTNILNLERCIIGGGISNAGDLFYDPLYNYFDTYVLPEAGKHCEVVKADLKNDAGILGCAAMVFMENA